MPYCWDNSEGVVIEEAQTAELGAGVVRAMFYENEKNRPFGRESQRPQSP